MKKKLYLFNINMPIYEASERHMCDRVRSTVLNHNHGAVLHLRISSFWNCTIKSLWQAKLYYKNIEIYCMKLYAVEIQSWYLFEQASETSGNINTIEIWFPYNLNTNVSTTNQMHFKLSINHLPHLTEFQAVEALLQFAKNLKLVQNIFHSYQ